MHADDSGQLEAEHGEPPTGVLLHDTRGSVGQSDFDDDARLRPAERRGEVGRRLAEHVGGRLDAGQHEVGRQLAERLRERERRRPRVVRVDLARVHDDHAVGPTRIRHAQRLLDPVRRSPTAVTVAPVASLISTASSSAWSSNSLIDHVD